MKRIIFLLVSILALPFFTAAQFVNNGATIVMTPGTQLVLNNISLQNDGNFNQAAGIVNFSGNANTFIGGNIVPRFATLNLNKPSATLQLQNNILIGNQLQFSGGLLDLNAHTATLVPGAQLANENMNSYATGPPGGYIETTVTLNVPVAANPGNLGAVISSSQNLGPVTIRRGHEAQTTSGGGKSIFRYYDLLPTNNTGLNATLRFNYLDAELNGLDENNLAIWKSNDQINWTSPGRGTNSTQDDYVEQTGINEFARFTLFNLTPLPLTWRHFNTHCASGQARISWTTEHEQNTASFIIRRSANAVDWTVAGTLPAAGNSVLPINYSYTDPTPLAGTTYYQIQQTDLDGKATLSPVLRNQCGDLPSLKVYPNPVRQQCEVSIQSGTHGIVQLNLYDSRGALIIQQKELIQHGNTVLELRLGNLTKGIYSLQMILPDGTVQSLKIEKL